MRFLRIPLGLLVAVVVHLVGVRLFGSFPLLLDPFLILTVMVGRGGSSLQGMGIGLLAGLTRDALQGGLYGLHGFADTLCGYATARLCQRLVIEKSSGVMLLVAAAAVVQQLVLSGLLMLMLDDPPLPRPGWWVAKAALSGLAGALIASAGGSARQLAERRRRGRLARLRLGE